MDIYQVVLETKSKFFNFEIATDSGKAADIARNWLFKYTDVSVEDYIHLGGYCRIGESIKEFVKIKSIREV